VSRLPALVRLARPFTLLAPALGMAAGSIAGIRPLVREDALAGRGGRVLAGVLLAILLNAASNAVNQLFDVEVDRVNKPDRPLPSGALTRGAAWGMAAAGALAALGIAWALPWPTLPVVATAAILVYAYSGPPFRTKRLWWAANPTIAIPRGTLLFIAGWTAVVGGEGLGTAEPWILGGMYGVFVLGAASTKDFADIPGDRAGGCVTLPIRFGVAQSARIIAPFLVLPWLALPAAVAAGALHGRGTVLAALGAGLALWGAYTASLLLRDPDALTRQGTHPAWAHMYLMMAASQAGVAAAYWGAP